MRVTVQALYGWLDASSIHMRTPQRLLVLQFLDTGKDVLLIAGLLVAICRFACDCACALRLASLLLFPAVSILTLDFYTLTVKETMRSTFLRAFFSRSAAMRAAVRAPSSWPASSSSRMRASWRLMLSASQ